MKTDLFTDVADEMILYSVYVCMVCVPDKNQLVFFIHNSFCLMLRFKLLSLGQCASLFITKVNICLFWIYVYS